METTQVWYPGTTIRLVKVPWDATYRDVVQWEGLNRDVYFSTLPYAKYSLREGPFTYIRPYEPVDLDVEFNLVKQYNYLVVENPPQLQDRAKTFYYFITGSQYLAPGTTRVNLQLDTWTTFEPSTSWGTSFIERGHLGIANSNSTIDNLREYQTLPEDLDTGTDLMIRYQEAKNLFTMVNRFYPSYRPGMKIVLMSTVDLTVSPGNINEPTQQTTPSSDQSGLVSAMGVYVVPEELFQGLMNNLRYYPWISRNISCIYAIPTGLFPLIPGGNLASEYGGMSYERLGATIGAGVDWDLKGQGSIIRLMRNIIPAEYQKVLKLLTWPFAVIELSGYDGAPVYYKPQFMHGGGGTVDVWGTLLMPFAKIAFFYSGYNAEGNIDDVSDTVMNPPGSMGGLEGFGFWGETLDSAVWMDNFPQFPLVNDMYLNFMANTAYTRQYQYQQAGWQQTKSLTGAQTQFDIGQGQMATNVANNESRNTAMDWERGINAAAGVGNMVVQGVSGNWGNVASGAISTAQGVGNSIVQQNLMNQQFANNQGQLGFSLDKNLQYAQMAANGDYNIAVAGILSQVQQAQLTPPSVSGQSTGAGFALSQGAMALKLRVKMLSPNLMRVVGDYFLRYGVAIRRFIQVPSTFLCMDKFAYWRCYEAYIVNSDGDETEKATLRGILQKGVTVWAHPDMIGTTTLASNNVVGGFNY